MNTLMRTISSPIPIPYLHYVTKNTVIFTIGFYPVKRLIMRHSTQMREELKFMTERVNALINQALSNFPESQIQVKNVYHEELHTYKVKLEELFEETDVKEQSIKNDFLMLLNQFSYFDCFQGRTKIYIEISVEC